MIEIMRKRYEIKMMMKIKERKMNISNFDQNWKRYRLILREDIESINASIKDNR